MTTALSDKARAFLEEKRFAVLATINRELGQLVRGYVADAIEREIETWRKRET